ncbi:TPA: hypothetical protein DCQ22_00010 [Candidatus Nomurabacteria bacterium]|nr:hypothetical protein [Candidatus Nomurabacteria bacterium]
MEIVFPSDTKDVIDAIRGVIGREIVFHVVASATACTSCDLDPVTNTSTDSFCLECNGVYWVPTYSGIAISGHVAWGKSDQMRWEAGGQWFEGSCGAQVELTEDNLQTVNDTIYVTIDDKEMEIRKTMRRGVPELNRILIDLIEKEA